MVSGVPVAGVLVVPDGDALPLPLPWEFAPRWESMTWPMAWASGRGFGASRYSVNASAIISCGSPEP
ncbi:hypothetical protein BJF79_40770 [Actinomadura sp. CNU-125]|nr:hypothetical protein BJF79_40770 [Actinomadura sp. CNU-125]